MAFAAAEALDYEVPLDGAAASVVVFEETVLLDCGLSEVEFESSFTEAP